MVGYRQFFLILPIAIGLLLPPQAAAHSLRLDGVLLVKGMSMSDARVIVVTHDEEPRVITESLSRFSLMLELQREYLISFERPGCMSKQLHFNTHVPSNSVASGGFRFPFQVTLEAQPAGDHMEYAGPVGFIHYDPAINDFGYSTNYRINKDDGLSDRLMQARKTLDAEGSGRGVLVAKAKRSGSEPAPAPAPRPERLSSSEQLAPTVRHVPPMVHVLEKPEARAAEKPTKELKQARMAEPVMESSMRPIQEPARLLESEVKVDSLYVTTIVVRSDGDRKDEYRRVVSYYGSVTYFHNGKACSADTYNRGVQP